MLKSDAVSTIHEIAKRVAAQVTVASASTLLSRELASLLNAPLALLSCEASRWRFEAQAFPDDGPAAGQLARVRGLFNGFDPLGALGTEAGHWTAIALGTLAGREWALLLPGESSVWAARLDFEEFVDEVSWSLGKVAEQERADHDGCFRRRLHAFVHRLVREKDSASLYRLVLRTLAAQVRAQTGAIATLDPREDALAIVATLGYPHAIVEHLRIRPGEGLLGRVFESGRPLLDHVRAVVPVARIRYRTDSYMLLPLTEGDERHAVIALTDRSDGGDFDAQDFKAARLMAAAATSAFSAQVLRTRVAELTELATIDPVTGLFNRRHFETRLEAEVERARRQGQDLAVLLIDIDDFKQVNDTRGHLEGDRTLREVADLLRAGVRIFDVCARYGGEEFVIVMPAASVGVAQQVSERIRARIERSFAHDLVPVTVSVGIGILAKGTTADELLDAADGALISAKKAGKNRVCTAREELGPSRP
jgi:diguanylate cyclase (GGDEF)-like protein